MARTGSKWLRGKENRRDLMDLLYLYDDLTARREVYDSVGLSFVVKYKFSSRNEARDFALKNGAVLIDE